MLFTSQQLSIFTVRLHLIRHFCNVSLLFVDVNLRHWFLLKSSLIFKTDRRLSVVNMSCYTEEIHVAIAREVVALGKKVDSDSSENG